VKPWHPSFTSLNKYLSIKNSPAVNNYTNFLFKFPPPFMDYAEIPRSNKDIPP
jgi:hypothetical protein